MSNMTNIKEYLNKGNSIKELDEKAVLELINSGAQIVLKVWQTGCQFCEKYAPIFQKLADNNPDPNIIFAAFNLHPKDASTSEFVKKFLTVDGKARVAAPATLLILNKQVQGRHYGYLSEAALVHFLATGDSLLDVRTELKDLFAKKGAILTGYEQLVHINKRIEELQQRLGLV